MSWLPRFEQRFAHLAIPNLVRVLVGLNALVFALQYLNPDFVGVLALDPAQVMRGQVWRLVTWLFIPPQISPIWILFALMFYWMMGEGLEEAWGAFRVNLYFLVGMLGTTVVAFLFGTANGNSLLYLSLLFAFATLYPRYTILFMFILPIPVWWLAVASAIPVGMWFLGGGWADRISVVFLFANYLLFFGPGFIRHTRHRTEVAARRERYVDALPDETEPMHKCHVCGRTEQSDPHLEFRVGPDGSDYCADHLPGRS